MPLAAPSPDRVLRIGILHRGKLVAHRLMPKDAKVTVGTDLNATFSYPDGGVPGAFPLFAQQRGHVVMCFTEQMGGRIASGDARANLDSLRRDPGVAHKGNRWLLPLTDQDSGKVTLGELTVLFQFAPAPPTVAVQAINADFRPRLVEDDDPLYLGTLGTSTALAGILAVVMSTATVPETTMDDVPARFKKVLYAPMVTEMVEDEPEVEAEPEPKAEAEPQPEPEAEPEVVASNEPAPDREARIEELKSKSRTLQLIYSRGEGTVFGGGDQGLSDFDAVLDDLDGPDIALNSGGGTREGTTDTEDADIELTGVTGGTTDVTAVDHQFAGTVTTEAPDGDDLDDIEAIKRAVATNQGAMTYCYQRHAKANPGLSGRVELDVVLRGGRPVSTSVGLNTTGDAPFASCLVGKLKTWKFGRADTRGDVVSLPFVFSPG